MPVIIHFNKKLWQVNPFWTSTSLWGTKRLLVVPIRHSAVSLFLSHLYSGLDTKHRVHRLNDASVYRSWFLQIISGLIYIISVNITDFYRSPDKPSGAQIRAHVVCLLNPSAVLLSNKWARQLCEYNLVCRSFLRRRRRFGIPFPWLGFCLPVKGPHYKFIMRFYELTTSIVSPAPTGLTEWLVGSCTDLGSSLLLFGDPLSFQRDSQ